MTQPFLPYGRQSIDEVDIAAVAAVLRGDWLTTGPMVRRFEEAFAGRVKARFAVACSSGTAGLHLAALALGLGQGDSVVVPTMTFLATANAARYVGAEVLFSDVDPETGLMRVEDMDRALASAKGAVPRAVFPVHLKGQCVDMPALAQRAAAAGLAIVEDASHALGTVCSDSTGTYPVGSCRYSVMTVFSLHPVKTIAMGEGGVITTNDEGLYRRLMTLRTHGMVHDAATFQNAELAFTSNGEANPWYYEMPEVGFNYRASDIHCALALSQLSKLDQFSDRRKALAHRYDERLSNCAPLIHVPKRVPNCTPTWHLYAPRIDFEAAGISRSSVMTRLRAMGIGSQVHYVPVHRQPYYRSRYGDQALGGADSYYGSTLSLPLFATMTEADVDRVTAALVTVLEGAPA